VSGHVYPKFADNPTDIGKAPGLLMTEQKVIRRFIENIDVDAQVGDEMFYWLLDSPDGPGDVLRLIERKLIDFFVPDNDQMLYLCLTPQIPSLYKMRLESKPYDYGVMTKKRSYYLDFGVIDKILAESTGEQQPLTIFVSDDVIPPIVRHYSTDRYELPHGSRMVTCTKKLESPAPECEKIFGIPSIVSFYRPPGAVSYCCRTDEKGFRIPAWMRAESRENSLQFYDLGSLRGRAIVDTGQVGFVEDQYVR
jgi:hypothetical protein